MADPAIPLLGIGFLSTKRRFIVTEGRSFNNADTVGVHLCEINVQVFDRKPGGGDGILKRAIQTAGRLDINVTGWIEFWDFGRDLRWNSANVKTGDLSRGADPVTN